MKFVAENVVSASLETTPQEVDLFSMGFSFMVITF